MKTILDQIKCPNERLCDHAVYRIVGGQCNACGRQVALTSMKRRTSAQQRYVTKLDYSGRVLDHEGYNRLVSGRKF